MMWSMYLIIYKVGGCWQQHLGIPFDYLKYKEIGTLTHIYSVLLCLYLVSVEVTTVGTSLLSISNDLDGLEKVNWVVTGYLVTYTGRLTTSTGASWIQNNP
jgi:hypothetical protein